MLMKSLISLSALGAANAFGNMDYNPKSTAEAWDNHFSAFGAQDVQKIGLDYDDSSVLVVHSACEDYTIGPLIGRDQITEFFADTLFPALYDTQTLEVHAVDQYTDGVFLVWSNEGTGFDEVTDTFIFDSETHKILQQNVAVASTTCSYAEYRRGRNLLEGGHVTHSWDNHFEAFENQEIDRIMEDYVEDSVVAVYNFRTLRANQNQPMPEEPLEFFRGLAEIEGLFTDLFSDLDNLDYISAPVERTTDDPTENTFLVWRCPGCETGDPEYYGLVTDSFVYGGEAVHGPAIIRQNIVIFSANPIGNI